ncbi:hypothetical protein T11_17185 [Trichinella zimbabwensis]|uniref:Uncharacterized protein n=1 Tax=Trichinella zimbabwensis TaxID=268475 RepID=A0A0V1DMX2_9BILA|nr:hypothetical protein T11_17185 [Trichinella zimbabwensis]
MASSGPGKAYKSFLLCYELHIDDLRCISGNK